MLLVAAPVRFRRAAPTVSMVRTADVPKTPPRTYDSSPPSQLLRFGRQALPTMCGRSNNEEPKHFRNNGIEPEQAFMSARENEIDGTWFGLIADCLRSGRSSIDNLTHALCFNLAVRQDGTTGAVRSNSLYECKMAIGALYRCQLSTDLQRDLGLPVERVNDWFEIQGVSSDLTGRFSSRRKEVLQYCQEHGVSGAIEAEKAALAIQHPRRLRLTNGQERPRISGQ